MTIELRLLVASAVLGLVHFEALAVIQTTGFAPPNDLESAIFATLPNGNYTAILTGKNGETGVGLLDVYKVSVATNN